MVVIDEREKQSMHQVEPEKADSRSMIMVWMMVMCCGLPALLFFALPMLGLPRDTGLIVGGVIAMVVLACCVGMFAGKRKS